MLVGSILSLPVRNRAMKNSFNSKLLYFTKNQPEAPFHRLKDQFSLEILPLAGQEILFPPPPPIRSHAQLISTTLPKKRSHRHRNPPKKPPLCNSPTESPSTPHEIPSPTEPQLTHPSKTDRNSGRRHWRRRRQQPRRFQTSFRIWGNLDKMYHFFTSIFVFFFL